MMKTPIKMLHRSRVKVCGLTRHEDVKSSIDCGVDALGFVFYLPSKRCLTAHQAAHLVEGLPAFVSTVALFVEPSVEMVKDVIDVMRPTVLQFHGAETPEFCRQFKMPYIKAVRVGAPELDSSDGLTDYCMQFQDASAWLFDSYTPAYGGSGHSFDRQLIVPLSQHSQARPILISGGLTVENVGESIDLLMPWGVDVSSGVEIAPGIKSAEKVNTFVQAVRFADIHSDSRRHGDKV
jgi:phosphoribosylanthranilate isomerase